MMRSTIGFIVGLAIGFAGLAFMHHFKIIVIGAVFLPLWFLWWLLDDAGHHSHRSYEE